MNSLWSLIQTTFRTNSKTPYQDLNALTYNDYYFRLQTIARSLFEWENLPNQCNVRYLEKSLYLYGYALFFKDPKLGLMIARCTQNGNLNYYDEPVAYSAYGTGYSRQTISARDSVLIRNNVLERPTDDSIVLFASRLTENQRTIDINLNAQKTPVFISCDEQDRMTIENIYSKYEGGSPVILGGKKLSRELIQAVKTDAPYVIDKLDDHDTKIWNDIYTFFGINNANIQKKERLITDEANANNGAVSINAQTMLLTRQEACDQMNKMFELDPPVSVKMRDLTQMVDGLRESEEGDNGELHD